VLPAGCRTHLDLLLEKLLEAGDLHDLVIDWFAAVDGEGEGLGLLCGRLGLLADCDSHDDEWHVTEYNDEAEKDRAGRFRLPCAFGDGRVRV
jgi:hypothetical protein